MNSTHAPEGASGGARPFRTADEAWLWTMAALTARRDGAGIVTSVGETARPCDPDDVVRCLDRLYRQRRIDLVHARILRIWGERQVVPDPKQAGEGSHARLWREAMARLDWPLRMIGVVAGDPAEAAMAHSLGSQTSAAVAA